MPSYYEWRYVVEVEVGPDSWRSIDNYDSKEEAIKAAKDDSRKARVRAFKTTIFTQDEVLVPESTPYVVPEVVATVDFFCPSHPTETSKALKTSTVRCKQCHQQMFEGYPSDLEGV